MEETLVILTQLSKIQSFAHFCGLILHRVSRMFKFACAKASLHCNSKSEAKRESPRGRPCSVGTCGHFRERVSHSRTSREEGARSAPRPVAGSEKDTHTYVPMSISTKPTSLCSPCFTACCSHLTAYQEHFLPLITALLLQGF